MQADVGECEIERRSLTLSIIATAIGNGQRVMLRESCLAQAMGVSTAVPGLLAPLTVEGQRMVDGGLADNVPIREARERCNAAVVIAINVGSPLLPPEQASGSFSVAALMVALLAEQNVSASLATLKPGDIYIQPDLGTITAGDFDRHAEAAERGSAEAEQVVAKLRALAVDAPGLDFVARAHAATHSRRAAHRRDRDRRQRGQPRQPGRAAALPGPAHRSAGGHRPAQPRSAARLRRRLLRAGRTHPGQPQWPQRNARDADLKAVGPNYSPSSLRMEATFGDVAEEPLHHVQPRIRSGREVHVESRVLGQPIVHDRMLEGGVLSAIRCNVLSPGISHDRFCAGTSAIRRGYVAAGAGR